MAVNLPEFKAPVRLVKSQEDMEKYLNSEVRESRAT